MKRRLDETASGFQGQHSPPAFRRVGVAGLVHDGERQPLERTVHGVPEDDEVDQRKEHRRDDEHGLPPEREERALPDRGHAEVCEPEPARRRPLFPRALHASRSARPV